MDDNDPNKRADKCGNPFPDVCIPQEVRTPICYLTSALQSSGVTEGLPGILVVQINADCSGTVIQIEQQGGGIVPGAFQVPCPDTIGPGGFGSGQGNPPPPPPGGGD